MFKQNTQKIKRFAAVLYVLAIISFAGLTIAGMVLASFAKNRSMEGVGIFFLFLLYGFVSFIFTSVIARVVYMGADMAENVSDIKQELELMHKETVSAAAKITTNNTQQTKSEPSKMLSCPKCGVINPKGRDACYSCGAKLHD